MGKHWQNCEEIHSIMKEYQKHALKVKEQIEKNYKTELLDSAVE